MADNNTLQYVKLDYTSHRDALLQRVRSHWLLSWNDFLANNFGRIIVDLMAWSLSVLAYLVNRAAAENFFSTMTLRESAARIGALVSYRLRNPSAAVVMCEATIPSAATEDLKLAKGTIVTVSTADSTLVYELADDYTILEGATSPEARILTVDPDATGDGAISSQFTVTAGSEYADLIDSTIDLSAYVSSGQYLASLATGAVQHRITAVTASPTSTALNRLVLDPAWGADAGEVTGSISAKITENRVAFLQGQTCADSVTTPAASVASYAVKLSRQPVIEGSVVVLVDGSVWPVTSTLSLKDSAAQNVEVKETADGQTLVIFGDGIFGAMVPVNAAITVTYRVGGGSSGNVPVGSINATIIGQQVSGQVAVLITNSWSPGEGGSDVESLAEARANIPAHIRSNWRGVTLEDYQTLAMGFSGPAGQVKYARAVSSGGTSAIEPNVVTIYAWMAGPAGGLMPLPASLKTALLAYLQASAVGTDYVAVRDGTSRPAPVAVRFKAFSGFETAAVSASLSKVLAQVAASSKPGAPVEFSSLVQQLSSTLGVASLTVATPTTDLAPANSTEVFVPPSDTTVYPVDLAFVDGNTYEGRLPVAPLTPWCIKIYVGSKPILVVPDAKPGYAMLIGNTSGAGLATYDVGLKLNRPAVLAASMVGNFYYAADEGVLYRADLTPGSGSALYWKAVSAGASTIDLASGKILVSFNGDARPVSMSLITVQGYTTERTVNAYISYTGDNSLLKRREIRAALKAWAAGFKSGSAMFTQSIRGADGSVILAASRSNMLDVVLTVPGVTSVNKVAVDSPNNSTPRVDAAASELLKLGAITLNGWQD